jgi:hypothetical protein
VLKKYALLWAYLGSVAVLFGVAIVYMILNPAPEPKPGILLPCPTEDSDNCWWDATEHGNGEGLSFVVIDGKVTYLAPKGR